MRAQQRADIRMALGAKKANARKHVRDQSHLILQREGTRSQKEDFYPGFRGNALCASPQTKSERKEENNNELASVSGLSCGATRQRTAG